MKINEFISQSIRVIKISYKPSKEEFIELGKFCIIGTLILGLIGYLIYILLGS
ncbi:MAG: protein translocase SEC61 complex subunit gamma [Candidatus Micrarchaeia archaeon]